MEKWKNRKIKKSEKSKKKNVKMQRKLNDSKQAETGTKFVHGCVILTKVNKVEVG